MPRPRICRRVDFNENFFNFVPRGIRNCEECILTLDEYEAIRLIDLEGTEQSKAAKKIKVSQPTFSRILKNARQKISRAIVKGYSIKIQGGNYKMEQRRGRGLGQGRGRGLGVGSRGRLGGFSAGPGGVCICPKCGYETAQARGQPCNSRRCPKCKSLMTRK